MIKIENGEQINGGELVDRYWPYDGPHSAESVTDAARALAELVRYLNNATGPGNGRETLRYAPHIYRTLGALHGATSGMTQLLEQLGAELERIAKDPTAYDDRRGSDQDEGADVVARSAAHQLRAAHSALVQTGTHLGEAWGQTSHLGHDLVDEPDED